MHCQMGDIIFEAIGKRVQECDVMPFLEKIFHKIGSYESSTLTFLSASTVNFDEA